PAPGGHRARPRQCRGRVRPRGALEAAIGLRGGDLARLRGARALHRFVPAPSRAGGFSRGDERRVPARRTGRSPGRLRLRPGHRARCAVPRRRTAPRALPVRVVSGARVLAVVNQKGGVGKTTTSVNLAAALAQAGRRVLLVDLDPQGNATMGSGVDKRALARTVYHVLLGLGELGSVRIRAEGAGYDLLPANRELAGAEVELVELASRETRLRSALERVAQDYHFILIDCPPS